MTTTFEHDLRIGSTYIARVFHPAVRNLRGFHSTLFIIPTSRVLGYKTANYRALAYNEVDGACTIILIGRGNAEFIASGEISFTTRKPLRFRKLTKEEKKAFAILRRNQER